MSRIITTLFLCTISFLLNGQYAMNLIPRVSSDNSISETVAYTKISIIYGSPKVKGRKIWGEMEDYDQIWRAGANKATVIEFSEDVSIQGNPLPKGKYGLFVIPKMDEDWVVIFNREYDQWGAFNYKKEEDVFRIKVGPRFIDHTESLTYDIVANGFESAKVSLAWENVKLNFVVDVDYLAILEEKIAEAVKSQPENTAWVVYIQGAEHLIDQEEKLELAAEWLLKSEALSNTITEWSGQYYPQVYVKGNLLWCKARLQALKGNFVQAISFGNELKEMEGDYLFYEKENESESIDLLLQKWAKKL